MILFLTLLGKNVTCQFLGGKQCSRNTAINYNFQFELTRCIRQYPKFLDWKVFINKDLLKDFYVLMKKLPIQILNKISFRFFFQFHDSIWTFKLFIPRSISGNLMSCFSMDYFFCSTINGNCHKLSERSWIWFLIKDGFNISLCLTPSSCAVSEWESKIWMRSKLTRLA